MPAAYGKCFCLPPPFAPSYPNPLPSVWWKRKHKGGLRIDHLGHSSDRCDEPRGLPVLHVLLRRFRVGGGAGVEEAQHLQPLRRNFSRFLVGVWCLVSGVCVVRVVRAGGGALWLCGAA